MADKGQLSSSNESATLDTNDWNEARLQHAVTRLQEMHKNVRQLRDAIPSMINTLQVSHPTPEILYMTFSGTATGAVKDIQQLTRLIQEPGSREIFQKAKEANQEPGRNVEGWLVTQDPTWLDAPLEKGMKEETTPVPPEQSIESAEGEDSRIKAIVKKFQEKYPDIDLTFEEGTKEMRLPKSVLAFQLSTKQDAPGSTTIFGAKCKGASKLANSITQAIEKRPDHADLQYLLEMLASYINATAKKCIKCDRNVAQQTVEFAVLRHLQGSLDDAKVEWEPLHPSCA